MKTIAALILASLLAVMGYGIFWLVCLTYTTDQLRGAVKEALGAEITFGTAQWVPDPTSVVMDLPAAKITLHDGPIREIRTANLRLQSGFLMRDRWTMELPSRVEIVMASGKTLLLETEKGEVMWLRDGNRLTVRADKLELLDLSGVEIAQIGDVMVERKAADTGVRVSLASRPKFAGGEGLLSGQLVLPAPAFAKVLNLLGTGTVPGVGQIFQTIATSLKAGGSAGNTLDMDNVSFKLTGPQAVSGAVFGKVQVLGDGHMTGTMVVTADSTARVVEWVQRAGLIMPRTLGETSGVTRFTRDMAQAKATVRLENMQTTLLLNGQPVGPLPVAQAVVSKLWP